MHFGITIAAIFLWAQTQIISAAITGKNRVPVALFWVDFASILAATIVIARLIRSAFVRPYQGRDGE
ncbi:MAG: hypothetical protein WBE30_01775 [Candidatus Cybelea sp.]